MIYAIPGADLYAKGASLASKAGKYSKTVTAIFKMLDIGGHIAAPMLAAYDFGSAIGYMIDKYMVYESDASAATAVEVVLLVMGGYQTYRYKDMFGDYFGGTPKPTTSMADMSGSADKTVVIKDGTTSGHLDMTLQLFGGSGEGGSNPNVFKAPEITTNNKGELTNGVYTLNQQDMLIHVDGHNPNKSQFLYDVDANKAVLDAAAYADANNLWVSSSGNIADFANIQFVETDYVYE